jgi:hypothetical protein
MHMNMVAAADSSSSGSSRQGFRGGALRFAGRRGEGRGVGAEVPRLDIDLVLKHGAIALAAVSPRLRSVDASPPAACSTSSSRCRPTSASLPAAFQDGDLRERRTGKGVL